MRERPGTAVIVGAGIAGLASALTLSRSGWEVTLVERASGLRGGAYVVGFSELGYDAAQRLGLAEQLHALASPWREAQHVDADGHTLARMSVPSQQALVGKRIVSILRGDLEQVLYDAVAELADIQFDQTIVAIEQHPNQVTLTLRDGSIVHSDLLLGADGLHSAVRRMVFGPESRYCFDFGASVISFDVDGPPEPLRERTTFLGLVGRGAGAYPQRDGRLSAFFTFIDDSDGRSGADAAKTLRAVYGDLRWVWPDLLEKAEGNSSVFFDRIAQIRMREWTSGNVALVGDSAWSVSLLAGAGSSLAVGGAHILADKLDANTDIPTALLDWERSLRPHVRAKQRQGRYSRQLFIPTNRFSLSLRHMGLRVAETLPIR